MYDAGVLNGGCRILFCLASPGGMVKQLTTSTSRVGSESAIHDRSSAIHKEQARTQPPGGILLLCWCAAQRPQAGVDERFITLAAIGLLPSYC